MGGKELRQDSRRKARRHMKKSLFVIVMLMAGATAFAQFNPDVMFVGWQPPIMVQETINPAIPYAGFTQMDQWGRPFIMYNPNILSRLPQPLWVFLRAHEYGHAIGRLANEA